jgi:nitroimidazol reductase NimA-like FMN-containing flavoprotein (pyridoxamine 5'-phosphate oxidase superfamily)
MLKPPRQLGADEVEQLLARDVPARLATVDAQGFPHVTPLRFVWRDGAFYMTSVADRPHLRRIARNPRVGIERIVICLRPARLIAVASV